MKKSTKSKSIWTKAFPKQALALHPEPVKREKGRRLQRHTAKQLTDYKRLKVLMSGMICEFPECISTRNTEAHHTRGRNGNLISDNRYIKWLCRKHHNWVHANPSEARKLGLLADKGDWGKQ